MAQIKNDRIPVVDFLRAFTLFGVAASNYMYFQNQDFHQTGINIWISAIEKIFFGPVWIILSFLFGFGFWSLIEKMKSQNKKVVPIFMRRMFWLFLIGILNAVFYFGDILRDFAIMGLLLLFFLKINKKTLFYFTLILTVLIPFVASLTLTLNLNFNHHHPHNWLEILPFLDSENLRDNIYYNFLRLKAHQITNPYYLISIHFEMFVLFLWGILSFRYQIFDRAESLKKFTNILFIISLTGIAGIILTAKFFDIRQINQIYHLMVLREIFYAAFTLFSGLLFYQIFTLFKIQKPIVSYGKMTLTNYIFQNLVSFILIFGFGFGLGTKQELWIYFSIAVAVYFLQVLFSSVWLKHFRLGPFEWIWRSLSSNSKIPIKK